MHRSMPTAKNSLLGKNTVNFKMKRRPIIIIFCMFTCIFTLAIWKTGSRDGFHSNLLLFDTSSSSFGKYFDGDKYNNEAESTVESLFRIEKDKKLENAGEEYSSESGSHGNEGADPIGNKTAVLMWTKYYAVKDSVLMGLLLSGKKWDPDCCSADDLIVTLDKSLLPNATVVVFYNYFDNLKKKDLPPFRPPGQLWVIFSKESPAHSWSLNQFPNLFNWTMSYRQDSDIWAPYGMTVPLESPIPPSDPIIMPGDIPLSQWIASKTQILAGVISHCRTESKREILVKALRNSSLPVDIYGSCGNKRTCPRKNKSCDHQKFWRNLASTYKFYFAAENSICTDYITEKFWRTLDQGMVPLAYGGANYTAVAPPNSFIDARQFSSPQEIATFLKNLSEDPVEYAKYFEWKRNYRVILPDGWGGFCKLCLLARQYKNNDINEMELSPYKNYESLTSWWHRTAIGSKESACVGPPFHL